MCINCLYVLIKEVYMSLSFSLSFLLPSSSSSSLPPLPHSLSLSFRIVIYEVVIYSTLTSEVLTWQVLILPISLPHSTCRKLSMSTCLSLSHPQRTFSKDLRMNHRTRRRIPNRMSSCVPANGSVCVRVCHSCHYHIRNVYTSGMSICV